MAVTKVTVAAALVALAACAVPDDVAAPTQATPPPTTTTQVPPPTTAPTTTSTASTADSTVPLVEGIPPGALALIGAPMPEVDLSFEEPTEEIAKRWVEQWAAWSMWLRSNPTDDPNVLSVAIVPGSSAFLETEMGMRNLLEVGWRLLGVPGALEIERVELGAVAFEKGFVQVTAWIRMASESWVIADGESTGGGFVEEVLPRQTVATRIVYDLVRSEEGSWRLDRQYVP